MEPEHILVYGATGGIGQQLVRGALSTFPKAQIYAVARDAERLNSLRDQLAPGSTQLASFVADPSHPEGAEEVAAWLGSKTNRLDWAFHTLGTLNGRGRSPEKNLREVELESLVDAFKVNAFSALWLSRSLRPFFRHQGRSILMFLSAKVGSIADNQLGGWYAYRMSKAALNMGVRNIALEYGRSSCPTIVVAVHPGTTLTSLSRDHLKGYAPERVADPKLTAERLLSLAAKLEKPQSGSFFHWDGSPIPW